MQKIFNMTETLAHGYSSESVLMRAIQWIPTWQGLDGYQKFLRPSAYDESCRDIGRVKNYNYFLFPARRSCHGGAGTAAGWSKAVDMLIETGQVRVSNCDLVSSVGKSAVHSPSQQGFWASCGHPNPQKSSFMIPKIFCEEFLKC